MRESARNEKGSGVLFDEFATYGAAEVNNEEKNGFGDKYAGENPKENVVSEVFYTIEKSVKNEISEEPHGSIKKFVAKNIEEAEVVGEPMRGF